MSIFSPRASGLGNSAAYQVSGKPYYNRVLQSLLNPGTRTMAPARDIYKVDVSNGLPERVR